MHQENRRSFVKKSLATSISISFAGLIRAHGEEGGQTTTWNPEVTTIATTDSGGTTTWDPNETTIETTPSPEDTTTWNPDETTCVTTLPETTAIAYEYALKCTADPTDETGPGWSGTDDGSSGWDYGTAEAASDLDPNWWGDDATLTCIVAGKGAAKDEIKTSFTISSKVTARWDNPGFLIQGQTIGEDHSTAIAYSQITIALPDPNSNLVQVHPQIQVTKNDSSPTNSKVRAHDLTIPAAVIAGSASYEDSGEDITIKQPIPEIGTEIEWTGKATNFKMGPILLTWSFVRLRRPRGSSDPWEIDPEQPEVLTQGRTPEVNN